MKCLALVIAAACSAPAVHDRPPSPRFDDLTASMLDHIYRLDPRLAIGLGLHEHDGQLPDRSEAGIAGELAAFRADRAALASVDPKSLTALQIEERATMMQFASGVVFRLSELDELHRNPMSYNEAMNLDAYIVRDYAPAAQRAAGVIALCRSLPAYLATARANIHTPIPRPWVETALLQTRGLLTFADKDVREALPGIPELGAALDTCKTALADQVAWLDKQLPAATNDFALGSKKFLAMLAQTEGIDVDLATLQRVAEHDLARNTAAIDAAATAIDPSHPVAEVVAAAGADRPAPGEVLEAASRQADDMRRFLIEHHIVTVPSDEVALVRPSPPFQRWNSAFLDGPGPFERVKLPSFYYISPPDPSWPPDVQTAYIPPRADLLFTTIHEVYPGHFIHALHVHRNPSRVLRSFWFYSTGEGWAHYAEEMMYDAGAAGPTPQAHIGQLKEALLRDVRFIVAIGEHTGGMTIAQAEQLFREKAFVDAGNAHQQAIRGTFDPMFLAYTLGKLAIRKLHDDWMIRHPDATLGDFHDAFLSHGAEPLPVIRRAMLGADDDTLL